MDNNQPNCSSTDYRIARRIHWNSIACQMDNWSGWGAYYHQLLAKIYRFLIPSGSKVLELGCGMGNLLAGVNPSYGLGIDISMEMICRAKKNHPDLNFIQADAHALGINEKFDVIILSDLLNDAWDVQCIFEQVRKLSTPNTRVIINSYSRLWELPLSLAEELGLAKPMLFQNWLTVADISNLLALADLEVIRSWAEILFPLRIPVVDELFNRYLAKIWPFWWFTLTNFIVARPKPHPEDLCNEPSVSVIVPARNEAGNINQIFMRTPELGKKTEIIFVEGHSNDHTYEIIQEEIKRFPQRSCQLYQQTGSGKGDAVRLGFDKASGDILMILDADLTVPPEDLVRFYDVLITRKGDLINGVRLVYPMEKEAMRFVNFLGNKFFSIAFTWLLGQPIKDTLCGTKVLWKHDYERIAAGRSYFGDFDPFGDFDLLFGAAKLNLRLVDLPIRYRERTYGTTNIQRWKHGWLLLKMVAFAAMRVKFF